MKKTINYIYITKNHSSADCTLWDGRPVWSGFRWTDWHETKSVDAWRLTTVCDEEAAKFLGIRMRGGKNSIKRIKLTVERMPLAITKAKARRRNRKD